MTTTTTSDYSNEDTTPPFAENMADSQAQSATSPDGSTAQSPTSAPIQEPSKFEKLATDYMQQSMNQHITAAQNELNMLGQEIIVMEHTISDFIAECQRLSCEVEEKQDQVEALQEELKTLQLSKSVVEEKISTTLEKIAVKEAKIASLRQEIGALKAEVKAMRTEVQSLQQQLQQLECDLTRFKSEQQTLERLITAEARGKEQLHMEINRMHDQLEQLKIQIAMLKKSVQQNEATLAGVETQIANLQEVIANEEIALKQLQDQQRAEELREQELLKEDVMLERQEQDAMQEEAGASKEVMIVQGLLLFAKAMAMLASVVTLGKAGAVAAKTIPLLEARLKAAKEKQSKAKDKAQATQNIRKENKSTVNQLQQSLSNRKIQMDAAFSTLSNHRHQLQTFKENQSVLQRKISSDMRVLNTSEAEECGVKQALERHENQHSTVQQRLEDLKTNITDTNRALDVATRKHTDLNKTLRIAEGRLRTLESSLENHEIELAEDKDVLRDLQHDAKLLQEEEHYLNTNIDNKIKEIKSATDLLHVLKEQCEEANVTLLEAQGTHELLMQKFEDKSLHINKLLRDRDNLRNKQQTQQHSHYHNNTNTL